MEILEIIKIVLSIISTSIIPLIFALIRLKRDLENAQNDVDREKSIVEMFNVVRGLIQSVEIAYNEATGKEKKAAVLAELENYAIEKSYPFEYAYWDKVVDDFVTMTNEVNVHK